MSRYDGSYCPICHEILKEEDDVVVCPICGAAYHRACYQEKGACIFPELHETGKSYEPEFPKTAAEEVTPPAGTVCPRCGATVRPENVFCPACGTQVRQPNPGEPPQPPHPPIPLDPYGSPMAGLEAEEQMGEGHTVKDMMVFVRQNTPYFLIRFVRFFRRQPTFDFNFASLLFGPFYFLYRKMYFWAGAFIFGTILAELPGSIDLFHYLFTGEMFFNSQLAGTLSIISYFLTYGLRFVMALFANRLYYKHCLRKMTAVKEKLGPSYSEQEYYGLLTQKGGVGWKGILFFFVISLLISGILSAVLTACCPEVLIQMQENLQTLFGPQPLG